MSQDGINLRIWNRKLHRWGAVATALPFILVISTGILLQVKKQLPWVQPKEQRTPSHTPTLTMEQIMASARAVPAAQVTSWDDIDRLDVRPGKGIVKLITKSRWELQLDLADGRVLQSTYRRSDLIESLHDGSFFSDTAKLGVFLPSGIIVLGLWITGVYLWLLPIRTRAEKRRKMRT